MRTLIIAVFIGVFLSSCNDEPKERTSILGTWNCEEVPNVTTPSNYQVNIKRNLYLPGESNQYIINNFYKMGHSEANEVYFYQDLETLELIINPQTVRGTGTSISGRGVVEADFSRIRWTYTVDAAQISEIVTATYY